jgi:hypothetical protein
VSRYTHRSLAAPVAGVWIMQTKVGNALPRLTSAGSSVGCLKFEYSTHAAHSWTSGQFRCVAIIVCKASIQQPRVRSVLRRWSYIRSAYMCGTTSPKEQSCGPTRTLCMLQTLVADRQVGAACTACKASGRVRMLILSCWLWLPCSCTK